MKVVCVAWRGVRPQVLVAWRRVLVQIVGFRVSGFGFRVLGFKFRVSGSGFRFSGVESRFSSFRFRGQGFQSVVRGTVRSLRVLLPRVVRPPPGFEQHRLWPQAYCRFLGGGILG